MPGGNRKKKTSSGYFQDQQFKVKEDIAVEENY
jgi:hypothetical protein